MSADLPKGRWVLGRLYRQIRPLLFLLEAERAHNLTLGALAALLRYPATRAWVRALLAVPALPTHLMGLALPNPVGLAAGLDKDGRYVEALSCLGFGWLELGTVTPKAQVGNPHPRLFRLPAREALINRMGFNNAGVAALGARLATLQPRPVLGINIGKNRDTTPAAAVLDYVTAFQTVSPYADYVALNVSSPNTPGLRDLQAEDALERLLTAVKDVQARMADKTGRYVPLALKIAPDLECDALDRLAAQCEDAAIDCVIATNTTLKRPPGLPQDCAGGLSGLPLAPAAAAVLSRLHHGLKGRIPIVSAGGISTAETAWQRLTQGATAIQLYTGLIYEGPTLVAEIVNGLQARMNSGQAQAHLPAKTHVRSERTENPPENRE